MFLENQLLADSKKKNKLNRGGRSEAVVFNITVF